MSPFAPSRRSYTGGMSDTDFLDDDTTEADPKRIGAALGMQPKAILYGIGLLTGGTKWRAYRDAGYSAPAFREDDQADEAKRAWATFRSAASKAANTKKMRQFLQRCSEAARAPDKNTIPMTDAERLLLLDNAARGEGGAATQAQIRAALGGLEVKRHMEETREEEDFDPLATLRRIAKLSRLGAFLADELARVNSVPFSSVEALAMPSAEASQYQKTQAAVRAMIEGHSASMMNGSEMAGAQG